MTQSIANAKARLVTIMGVTGIKRSYSNPPEMGGEFPYAYVVPLRLTRDNQYYGKVTFKAEVHVARGVLGEADKVTEPLWAPIEAAIWTDPTLAGTVSCVNELRMEYVEFTVGAEHHIGLRVEIDTKIMVSV